MVRQLSIFRPAPVLCLGSFIIAAFLGGRLVLSTLVKIADEDADGKLSAQEFLTFVRRLPRIVRNSVAKVFEAVERPSSSSSTSSDSGPIDPSDESVPKQWRRKPGPM